MKSRHAYAAGVVLGLVVATTAAWAERVPPARVPADTSTIAKLAKVPPKEADDPHCADIGAPTRAGSPVDTDTDLLKNRIDTGNYTDVSFGSVLALPWKHLPRRRYDWSAAESASVAKYERAAVRVSGYLIAVKQEGPEATNCESQAAAWHDWHLWLVSTEAEAAARDKAQAIVIEITPRVRALQQQSWDIHQLAAWAHAGQRVQVSGWLLLDPDHPDQVGKSRGTIWEIHPVMRIGPAQ